MRTAAPLFPVLVLLLPALAPGAAGQSVAITGGEVHTVSDGVVDGGTVLIRGGRIHAVGSDVDVPADARTIDATGKVVTPGLIDSHTGLGVVEVGAAEGTVDRFTTVDRITAAFDVAPGINPSSTLIPVTRIEGVTRAVVTPEARQSLIAGQGVLVDLGGDRLSEMLHADPAGMFVALGQTGARLAGGARGAAFLQLREALQDALDYADNREAYRAGQRRPYALSRLDLEALVPVIRGEVPLVVNAHRASDILSTLRLLDEFPDLDLVVTGALEGWRVADELAAAEVPVVTNPLINLPGFESLGATYENAARMHEAGVRVVLSSFESHNARNVKQAAGNAVSYGLPHDAALRAVTLTPAEVWGVADGYGSLEEGKDADVVVWSGDPFELTTTAEHVFIEGREIPKESRQRALFERYRDLEGLPPLR